MKLDSISASKVKSNKMCEFKFFLEYHKKLKMKKSFAAEQGTLIHTILEHFAKSIKTNLVNPTIARKWIVLILKEYRNGLWKLSKKALEKKKRCQNCEHFRDGNCFIANENVEKFDGCPIKDFNDAISLVEKVINDPGSENPLNKKIIDVENRFEILVGPEKIPIRGIIDIVTELDKDTIEILDYKTGTFIQTPEECQKDPQLLMYHLCARQIYPQYKNILITIYYLRDKPYTFAFNENDEKGTINSISLYWHSIKNNKFPRRRCDKSNGKCYFDWRCKGLCSPEMCAEEYKKFIKVGSIDEE